MPLMNCLLLMSSTCQAAHGSKPCAQMWRGEVSSLSQQDAGDPIKLCILILLPAAYCWWWGRRECTAFYSLSPEHRGQSVHAAGKQRSHARVEAGGMTLKMSISKAAILKNSDRNFWNREIRLWKKKKKRKKD